MEIFKIIAIAVCTLFATITIKNVKPEFAILVSLSGGILILLLVFNLFGTVFSSFNQIIEKTGLSNQIFKLLIKVVGIGYITGFTSDLCQDCGVSNLSNYVNLAGKITILVLCFPIFKGLLNLVVGLV